MLTMLTRQQIAADSSVQLKKNVSFCSILFCTVGRDCTEQMSGLVQDFRSFRGLQWHHQCLPEVAGRRPWKFESRHVQCFRLIYQMSQSAFTLHYVSIESCFGFGGTHTHKHTHTHPAAETGQELETTGKGIVDLVDELVDFFLNRLAIFVSVRIVGGVNGFLFESLQKFDCTCDCALCCFH